MKEKIGIKEKYKKNPFWRISIECFQKDFASDLHSIELPEVKTVDLFSDSDLHSIELPEVNLHSIELPEVKTVDLFSDFDLHSIELPEVNLHSIELPEVKISLVEERGCKENRIPHEISETPPAESFSETDEERKFRKLEIINLVKS